MSVKKAVLGMVLAAFAAGQAVADIPDGKGGRTSPQAGTQAAATRVVRNCCEKTLSGDCKHLVVAIAKSIEPRIPPQRAMVMAPALTCRHMPAPTGAIETRDPPQRAPVVPEAAVHHACCESARCKSHVG